MTSRSLQLWFCVPWPREGSAFQEKKGTAQLKVPPEMEVSPVTQNRGACSQPDLGSQPGALASS